VPECVLDGFHEPSKFLSTSVFQNRNTSNPCERRNASRLRSRRDFLIIRMLPAIHFDHAKRCR